MNFDQAIERLTQALKRWKPVRFNPYWIYWHEPKVYRFIQKNIRTGVGRIDWDCVTSKLDRPFQALWHEKRIGSLQPYSDHREVEIAIRKYWDKRYVFFTYDREDDEMRNLISVALVRLAQRGNVAAEEELMEFLVLMVGDWVGKYRMLWRWQLNPGGLREQCKLCIYRYRYTGTFPGYLYKTLEYSSLQFPRPQLLDDTILDGDLRRVDRVVQDPETGENRMAEYNTYSP
ncbi:MAG: hypothetical protein AAB489_03555 [Patescibacteria group bacterium]